MGKLIDAEAFLKLYKLTNGNTKTDHVIALVNMMPDERKSGEPRANKEAKERKYAVCNR